MTQGNATSLSTALVLTATEHVVADRPHPRYRHPVLTLQQRLLGPVAPGYLRVAPRLVGVCGTDLGVVSCDPETGFLRGSAPLRLPLSGRVLGHEGIAQVVEAGPGVEEPFPKTFSPGTWVGFESLLPCGECEICAGGSPNECLHATLMGLEQDGLFTDLADIPAKLARPLGDLATTDQGRQAAACVEPAACSLRALRIAGVGPRDRVVIFGAGPIGAAAAMLAHNVFHAARVCVVEPLRFRRERAAKWATEALDVETYFDRRLAHLETVVIEASGDLRNVERVIPRMGPGGRIVLMARSGAPLTLSSVDPLISSHLSLIGCRGHAGGPVPEVMQLVKSGQLPLQEIVTGVVDGLDALATALRAPEALARSHCKLLARV